MDRRLPKVAVKAAKPTLSGTSTLLELAKRDKGKYLDSYENAVPNKSNEIIEDAVWEEKK